VSPPGKRGRTGASGLQMAGAGVVTVPPELVQPLRDGLYAEMQRCLDESDAAIEARDRERTRAVVKETFDRAERIRGVLDAVEWVEPEEGPPPVEVDLRGHRDLLVQALVTQAEAENDVAADTAVSEAKRSAAKALAESLTAFARQIEEDRTR
jgi:hypothetical protein